MSAAVRCRAPGDSVDPLPLPLQSDTELLARYAAGQDQAAFAVLVRRHGPLVLGVCRRVLGHPQDAEDAFQAAFLILARKAVSIRKQQSLGSWLYKVAYRTALRARAGRAQRKAGEHGARQAWAVSAPEHAADEDLRLLLDEEVRRLPEKYRAPVLLCYLQGRTNEEAARQLRCPTGTLKVRLLRARELLRKRLTRRGVGLTVAVLLAALAEEARAAVPERLTAAAARAGGSASAVSARAAALAEGVLRGMVVTKIKVAFAVLLAVLLLAFADGLTQRARAATASLDRPAPTKPAATPYRPAPDLGAPAPDSSGPPCLLVEQGRPGPRPRS
jgi:RNA polymerase sigma factor (sigma-70 family)